jgi:hypothetical protein
MHRITHTLPLFDVANGVPTIPSLRRDTLVRVMIEGPDQREMDRDVYALSKLIEKELA